MKELLENSAWAILPSYAPLLKDLLTEGELTAEKISARLGPARNSTARKQRSIEVLPVTGIITYRPSAFSFFGFGTSALQLAIAIRRAANDSTVGAILLDIDSPGGTVDGIQELHQEIMKARTSKPIVAVANSMAASAAYWVASAATTIISIPSGEVGSIGVIAMHLDLSEANRQAGVKITVKSAGRFKAEGNPFEPLTPEGEKYLQGRIDEVHRVFVGDVARGRGVGVKSVREDFGQGRMLAASRAKTLGMVDTIDTFAEALGEVVSLTAEARAALTASPRALAEAQGKIAAKHKARKRKWDWIEMGHHRE